MRYGLFDRTERSEVSWMFCAADPIQKSSRLSVAMGLPSGDYLLYSLSFYIFSTDLCARSNAISPKAL